MDASLLWHVGELGSLLGGAWVMGKMIAERVGTLEHRMDTMAQDLRADIRAVHERLNSEAGRVIPFRTREGG